MVAAAREDNLLDDDDEMPVFDDVGVDDNVAMDTVDEDDVDVVVVARDVEMVEIRWAGATKA